MSVKDLVKYADYQFIDDNQLDQIVEQYQNGESIGLAIERTIMTRNQINIVLSDLNEGEYLFTEVYSSMDSFMEKAIQVKPNLRCLYIDVESIQLTNQMLEWLCSSGKVEVIDLPEERHTLTSLPFCHLANLRYLFICADQQVQITDEDLKYMPQLEVIQLSHNNTVTNKGLSYCPKLKYVLLHSNTHVTDELNKYRVFVSEKRAIEEVDEEVLNHYFNNLKLD